MNDNDEQLIWEAYNNQSSVISENTNSVSRHVESADIYVANLQHDYQAHDEWLKDTDGDYFQDDDTDNILLRIESANKKLVIIYQRASAFSPEGQKYRDPYGKRFGKSGVEIVGAMIGDNYSTDPNKITDYKVLTKLDSKYHAGSAKDIESVVSDLESRENE